MDSDSDGDEVAEVTLVNDSKFNIFSVAARPSNPNVFLTGGSDDVAYVWNSNPEVSGDEANKYHSPGGKNNRKIVWSYRLGLDGKIQLWESSRADGLGKWEVRDSAQEVEDPGHIEYGEAFALGANDGSVWVYAVNDRKLEIKHALYSHIASCTAGAFTKDESVLCTVSEYGSFYAWDFSIGRSIVGLTAEDQRFAIHEGDLYAIAFSPSGSSISKVSCGMFQGMY
ncbi:60S ribosomal subunit assembly or modification protein [Rhizina undulata]